MLDSKYIESRSFEGPLYLTAGRILRDRTYSEFWCIERSNLLKAKGDDGTSRHCNHRPLFARLCPWYLERHPARGIHGDYLCRTAETQAHLGRALFFGRVIVKTVNKEDKTPLEVYQTEIDHRDKPRRLELCYVDLV
jgi:hypothetical protein